MTWTTDRVSAALEEARALVRSDGADLRLIEANEKAARVTMQLELVDTTCATGTCIMPGEILERMIAEIFARHLADELELRILDPRS